MERHRRNIRGYGRIANTGVPLASEALAWPGATAGRDAVAAGRDAVATGRDAVTAGRAAVANNGAGGGSGARQLLRVLFLGPTGRATEKGQRFLIFQSIYTFLSIEFYSIIAIGYNDVTVFCFNLR